MNTILYINIYHNNNRVGLELPYITRTRATHEQSQKEEKMKTDDIKNLSRQIAAIRLKVPFNNLAKFDAEVRDYLTVLQSVNDDAEISALAARWENRLQWLVGEPSAFRAPPCLIRQSNEATCDYINRCYQTIGVN